MPDGDRLPCRQHRLDGRRGVLPQLRMRLRCWVRGPPLRDEDTDNNYGNYNYHHHCNNRRVHHHEDSDNINTGEQCFDFSQADSVTTAKTTGATQIPNTISSSTATSAATTTEPTTTTFTTTATTVQLPVSTTISSSGARTTTAVASTIVTTGTVIPTSEETSTSPPVVPTTTAVGPSPPPVTHVLGACDIFSLVRDNHDVKLGLRQQDHRR